MPNSQTAHSQNAKRIAEHNVRFDPLLDSVIAIAKIFGITTTLEALSAGLPLEGNRITPALLPRAAARAGLTAKLARRSLDDLRPGLLPVVLLLNGNQACVLLEWCQSGEARVRFPENGESSDILTRAELDNLYAGIVCFVRPVFKFDPRTDDSGELKSKHWFWSVVFQNWRLYRDSLLAAW